MPDWMIRIVTGDASADDGGAPPPAKFTPFSQQVLEADNLSWKNETDLEHEPWPANPDGTPAAKGWGVGPVQPHETSAVAYSVAAPKDTQQPPKPIYGKVAYICKIHPTDPRETGELDILAAPPAYAIEPK